jgi:hypothetical protein
MGAFSKNGLTDLGADLSEFLLSGCFDPVPKENIYQALSDASLLNEPVFTEIVLPSEPKSSGDPCFRMLLDYLVKRNMPEWEVPNTLAKYDITSTALEMVNKEK